MRGKLVLRDLQHPESGSGYIVLAMGKMGGYELNFSSDIDLMIFFDPSVSALTPRLEAVPFFARLTRELVKLLQERTADGYVFRVDLRLRPDPSSTQIAISTDAALNYYESRGQNWERAALIKARPCAGDRAAGERLLRELSPFVWRKYLDYAAVADVHAMKQQIHAYRGHGEIAVEGHNVKLGRGGIREIEFFAQTQQLIAGGRNIALRGRETVATLAALAAGGWIDAATRDELTTAYEFLRRVEHRLQMIADEQIHTLPADRDALEAFARFLGFASRDTSPLPCWRSCARSKSIMSDCSKVRRICSRSSRTCRLRTLRTRERRSIALWKWAFGNLARRRRLCGAGTRRLIAPCVASRRGKIWPNLSQSSSTSSRARKIRMAPLPRSIISWPACAAGVGSCRCCGKILTSSASLRSSSVLRLGLPIFWRSIPMSSIR